jgi:hypothetical protein
VPPLCRADTQVRPYGRPGTARGWQADLGGDGPIPVIDSPGTNHLIDFIDTIAFAKSFFR